MKFTVFFVAVLSCGFSYSQKCSDCRELYNNKKYEEVIERVAVTADSAAIDDLVLLAKSYQNLGMKKDAIGAYSYILMEDENNVDALVSVGALFIEMEEYDNALFATDRALKFDAGNQNALYNKAVVLYYKEDSPALNKFVEEIIKKHPLNSDFLYVKGMSEIEKQQFEAAAQTFGKIEQINPKAPNFTFYQGYVNYKLNRMDLAKEKLKKSIEMKDEQIIDAYYYLAQIYVQEQNKVEACEAYTNAINLGDITLNKEADDYCLEKKPKKIKLRDRGVRTSF
ncbi:MAG: TPR-motif-containing protein [Crocinitomicaceae bacterium]|jgi:tetratricopeptide (TPR) repeat protein|nr:TPR-motif-containing protein [Crocinitomicaceae bacterium]